MATADELFDLGRQERLASQIGRERFSTMLAKLADRIDTSIADAGRLALAPAGLPALKSEAHAVAGLASNFGAISLASQARALEHACEAGDHAAVGAVLDAYLRVAKNTLSVLRGSG